MPDPVSHSPSVLVDGTLLPIAAAAAYTAPSGAGTRGVRIRALSLTTQTGAAEPVQLWKVESGGARANANRRFNASIPSDGMSHLFFEGAILDPGDAIHWVATNASAVSGTLEGWVMTD